MQNYLKHRNNQAKKKSVLIKFIFKTQTRESKKEPAKKRNG